MDRVIQPFQLQIKGGLELSGYKHTLANEDSRPTVIFAHGFKGYADWGAWSIVGDQFAAAGYDFIRFNFSHNGTSKDYPNEFVDLDRFAQNTCSKELSELNQVIDVAAKSSGPIYLIGHSRGGAIAILAAAQNKNVVKVATWAAVADFQKRFNSYDLAAWKSTGFIEIKNGRTNQIMPISYGWYQDYLDNMESLDVLHHAKNLNIPQLILHGKMDNAVHHDNALWLKEANPKAQLHLIEDANHVFNTSEPWEETTLPKAMQTIAEITVNFFSK